jgi:hypothetical protein
MTKKLFEFRVVYFKPSGKFYASDSFKYEVTCTSTGTAYMQDVVDYLKELRDGPPGGMPGLSGQWRGHIYVDCEHGFPCLISTLTADTE